MYVFVCVCAYMYIFLYVVEKLFLVWYGVEVTNLKLFHKTPRRRIPFRHSKNFANNKLIRKYLVGKKCAAQTKETHGYYNYVKYSKVGVT